MADVLNPSGLSSDQSAAQIKEANEYVARK